ncbi:alpha/beta fold hydrolase [Candidatus Berkiella aquae]|uniref:Alpha/beta hydrolase n=1 Tax=Candidatus Berkiella aquae TaxID=295108 RepID=A0A0Q9YZI3_9GAMM|nr:alpha/beta hydrolase [Candidatus Berkiella aquae]MCS5712614.1 alpha/beta hydrolase [Candidatus Berkiella aquae]
MSVKETTFEINGQIIAAKIWNENRGTPTLALHGWLDNAGTFDRLAPLLKTSHIVAIDFPGHGFSSHKPMACPIHLIDMVIDSVSVANHLGWDSFALLGHSLGACIASLIAGAIPSRIQYSLLVDALGPLSRAAQIAPSQLGVYLEQMVTIPFKSAPQYSSVQDALNARLKVNAMKAQSCAHIVERGLKQLDNQQWTWRTDPRLLMPLPTSLTEEQVLAFLSKISSPLCLVRPFNGYPFPDDLMQGRVNAVAHAKIMTIPGEHHVHLDDSQQVAECFNRFLGTIS